MVMTLVMKSLKFWSEMIEGRRRKATAATAAPTARFIVVTEAIGE
jgi:hypothetical protein